MLHLKQRRKKPQKNTSTYLGADNAAELYGLQAVHAALFLEAIVFLQLSVPPGDLQSVSFHTQENHELREKPNAPAVGISADLLDSAFVAYSNVLENLKLRRTIREARGRMHRRRKNPEKMTQPVINQTRTK